MNKSKPNKEFVKRDECPQCFYVTDSATCVSRNHADANPSPGDFAVCLNCGAANWYDDQLNLTAASEDDLTQFETEHPQRYQEMRRGQLLVRTRGFLKQDKRNERRGTA